MQFPGARDPKSDARKLLLVRQLRARTTVTNQWIASLLGMGGANAEHIGFAQIFELATIGQVFATTAVGGALGAWIGRRINRRRERHEGAHA